MFTPSICLIAPSSPLSLLVLFVFPSSPPFLISCPSSLFAPPLPSVIPSSSSPSVCVYWVLSSAHSLVDKWIISAKTPRNNPQTSLFNQLQLFYSCHLRTSLLLRWYHWQTHIDSSCNYLVLFLMLTGLFMCLIITHNTLNLLINVYTRCQLTAHIDTGLVKFRLKRLILNIELYHYFSLALQYMNRKWRNVRNCCEHDPMWSLMVLEIHYPWRRFIIQAVE